MKAWTLGALAVLLLAGCAAPPDAGTPGEGPVPGDGDQALPYRPNIWPGDLGLAGPGLRVSDGAEPTLVASKDGSRLWIGDTSGLYISEDGGQTWVKGASPFLLSADGWVMAEDDVGNLYFSTTTTVSLTIARSSDGGHTVDYSNDFVDVAPVADRPWIAAHGDGEVALFMYDFGRTTSETCVRSSDGGETWPDRGLLSQFPQGGGALMDERGHAYVGLSRGTIVDYGTSCLMSTGDLETTVHDMFPGDLGTNHMLNPDYENGTLYMAAVGPGNDHILLSGKRLDGSPKVMEIRNPASASVAFPRVAVHDGQIAVTWYGSETPGDPSVASFNGAFNVYVAVIDRFWGDEPAVQVARITDEPNHVGDICMGGIGCSGDSDRDLLDYFGMDFDVNGRIHIAYGHDGTGSDAEVRYAGIGPVGVPEPTEGADPTDNETAPVDPTDAPGPEEDRLERNLPPQISVKGTRTGTVMAMDASETYDPEGHEFTVRWTWGDGTFSEGLEVQHIYEPGRYLILIEAVDEHGAQSTMSHEAVIPLVQSSPTSEPSVQRSPTAGLPLVVLLLAGIVAVATRRP